MFGLSDFMCSMNLVDLEAGQFGAGGKVGVQWGTATSDYLIQPFLERSMVQEQEQRRLGFSREIR
jgi:hypothetical protein